MTFGPREHFSVNPLLPSVHAQNLHIAIVDGSSTFGSHMVKACQDCPQIESIICFAARTLPLFEECSKITRVVHPTDHWLFGGSWPDEIATHGGHLDAIVLLFDPDMQYGKINDPRTHDTSQHFDRGAVPPQRWRTDIRHVHDWAPVYLVAEAAYNKGARVCLWLTQGETDENNYTTKDMYRLRYDSLYTDVIVFENIASHGVNDGMYNAQLGCIARWLYPSRKLRLSSLYRRVWYRWLLKAVKYSDLSALALEKLLRSYAVTGHKDEYRYSKMDVTDGWSVYIWAENHPTPWP